MTTTVQVGPRRPILQTDTRARRRLLLTPVSALDFSTRSRRCMARLSIFTLGDLVRHSAGDLLDVTNFGMTSLREIQQQLASVGLALRDD
ncbi:MAG: hypothetical protein JNM56_01345 [Planctomycetia bacterium]|nr:hypothetical protein [Planctomycetia bacterium]